MASECTEITSNTEDEPRPPIDNNPFTRRGELRSRPEYFTPAEWNKRKDKYRIQGETHQQGDKDSIRRALTTTCTKIIRNTEDDFRPPIDNPPNRRGQVVPRPKYFSPEEWKKRRDELREAAEADQMVAQDFQLQSEQVMDQCQERADILEADVIFELSRRVKDIQFWQDELNMEFPVLNKLHDILSSQLRAVETCLASVTHIKNVDEQIFRLRECRKGYELRGDEVGALLIEEHKMVNVILTILTRLKEQCTEQTRLIRKCKYWLNEELKDKDSAVNLDNKALAVGQYSCEPKSENTKKFGDESNVHLETWEKNSENKKLSADRVVADSRQLRIIVDSTMRTSIADLKRKIAQTNTALERGILASIAEKDNLQKQTEMMDRERENLRAVEAKLKRCIHSHMETLGKHQDRLRIRNQRPSKELVRDKVQQNLTKAIVEHHEMLQQIFLKSNQAHNVRKELSISLMIAEDTRDEVMLTIAIDQVEVSSMRKTIRLAEYDLDIHLLE